MERPKVEGRETPKYQDSGKENDLSNRVGKPGVALYLDTSAIVKKYVPEKGSAEVIRAIAEARAVGTARIAKAEVSAAFGKAIRIGLMTAKAASRCREVFLKDWPNYYVTEVSESVVNRAETFAWTHQLRGYDAVHLGAASTWQDDLGQSVTIATFDVDLWDASATAGLLTFPENLRELIEEWSESQ
jgi:uncharacterized protein